MCIIWDFCIWFLASARSWSLYCVCGAWGNKNRGETMGTAYKHTHCVCWKCMLCCQVKSLLLWNTCILFLAPKSTGRQKSNTKFFGQKQKWWNASHLHRGKYKPSIKNLFYYLHTGAEFLSAQNILLIIRFQKCTFLNVWTGRQH